MRSYINLLTETRSDDEIVTVTAKIWYVSDFHGKYTKPTYAKIDETCEDNPSANELCDRIITSHQQFETIPEEIRNSWDEDTPHNRAQAVVTANLDYMNEALANSEIPIRYVQWGSVQDIGQTEEQIDSVVDCGIACSADGSCNSFRYNPQKLECIFLLV